MRKQRIVLLIAMLMLTISISATDESQKTEAEHAVVVEVVRMLEAGVEERVVLRWLDRGDHYPTALSSSDLIALTEAEASGELMDRLFAAPDPSPAPTAVAEPPSGEVPLTLNVRYRPFRDPEADEDEQWHLFVYIDGRPYTWSDGKQWLSNSKRNRQIDLQLPPGPHVLRLMQERHTKRSEGWRHEARACPEAIALELQADGARLELELKEPAGLGFGTKGSYRWTLWRGNEVETEGPLAGPPDDWAPLCDEIETVYGEGDKIPRRIQKQLDRCVRWADLWRSVTDAPDRDTVRSQLERFEFRPVVAAN